MVYEKLAPNNAIITDSLQFYMHLKKGFAHYSVTAMNHTNQLSLEFEFAKFKIMRQLPRNFKNAAGVINTPGKVPHESKANQENLDIFSK